MNIMVSVPNCNFRKAESFDENDKKCLNSSKNLSKTFLAGIRYIFSTRFYEIQNFSSSHFLRSVINKPGVRYEITYWD